MRITHTTTQFTLPFPAREGVPHMFEMLDAMSAHLLDPLVGYGKAPVAGIYHEPAAWCLWREEKR